MLPIPDRLALIESSFSAQTVPPIKLPFTYRLGLVLLCGLMIVLPLVYLALVGLAVYGVYYHAAYNLTLLSEPGGKTGFAIYLAPLIVGAILVFFMIKPLFAPRQKQVSPIQLKPGEEPVLEDFVNRICDAVNAPKPRSIAIDGEVNASASFEGGILAFITGRLRLTVGLPLLAGMPVHSVGGVLAHEFGHFAQGGGMRLTYIIRMINHWFARVVYGRDGWDESIENASRDSDFRIMILLWIARAFIFVVRNILWALMQIGNLASCYMARQMEYDADSYETRFAGSQVFAATSERLTKLSYASQLAYSQLGEHYETKRLTDNLPFYIESRRQSFTPEQIAQIDAAQSERKTRLLDTHPCDADRIAQAKRLAAPGIFALDEPATMLLADFAQSARAITQHHYAEVLGVDTSRIKLLDNEEIQAAETRKQAELAAAKAFLGGAATLELPLTLAPLSESASGEPHTAQLGQQLQAALSRLHQRGFDAAAFEKQVDTALEQEPTRYFDRHRADYEELSADASAAFSHAAAVRAASLEGSERERFLADYELFRALTAHVPQWFKVRSHYIALAGKLQRWNKFEPSEGEITAATRIDAWPIQDVLKSLAADSFARVRLPFADPGSDLTILDYLCDKSIQTGHTITTAYHQAAHFLGNFHHLYQRCLGKLALELAPHTNQLPAAATKPAERSALD